MHIQNKSKLLLLVCTLWHSLYFYEFLFHISYLIRLEAEKSSEENKSLFWVLLSLAVSD